MLTFIMLVGLPASGKSTIRKRLADKYPYAVVLSTDDLVEAAAQETGNTYSGVFPSVIDMATKKVEDLFDQSVNLGIDIIDDRTNLTRWRRTNKLETVIMRGGYNKVCIVVEVDEEERQKRMLERVGKTIPADVDTRMRESWQRPTVEEGFDEIIDATELIFEAEGE